MSGAQKPPDHEVVVDVASTKLTDLWKKEDYWAIWLGMLILAVGLLIFMPRPPADMQSVLEKNNQVMKLEAQRAPFNTIAWHKATSEKRKLRATNEAYAKKLKDYLDAPYDWKANPLEALYLYPEKAKNRSEAAKEAYEKSKVAVAQALEMARNAEDAAAQSDFADTDLNAAAVSAIAVWLQAEEKSSKAKRKASQMPYNRFGPLVVLGFCLAIMFGIGNKVMGRPMGKFMLGFAFVFVLAILAYMAETQQTMKLYGFGFPLWAIVFGMLISNTIGTPQWVKDGVQTEYFIKTGLVLLGAEVLFGKILAIGVPGIFVAWVVTPVVLITTFWFGQRVLKIPSKTLNITVSADMSVCGVSAAIATASACRAKKEELTLAIGLSMVFTAIMMVALPAFIKAVGIPEVLGGAWIGGTIDSTGAVAAAGAFLGDKAMYVAATVKMIQNILIGVIAFFVAIYWVTRVEAVPGQRVRIVEIWHRFPKFVLGFIGMSILFSLIDGGLGKDVSNTMVDHGVLRGFSRPIREWCFALAFASIGLSTDFRELKQYFKGGKPLILYVCGQTFNLALTLLVAYIMFYLVFPGITVKI